MRVVKWAVFLVIWVLVVGTCLWAANWQWSRHNERKASNALVASFLSSPPLSLAEARELIPDNADRPEDIVFPVAFSGEWDMSVEQTMVSPLSFNQSPGFGVLAVFVTDNGERIIVNRGWQPLDTDLSPIVESETNLSGYLRLSQEALHVREGEAGLPVVSNVGAKALADWSKGADQKVFVEIADLSGASESEIAASGSFPVPYSAPPLSAGPHLGYVGQWLIFAVIFAVGPWVVLHFRYKKKQSVGVNALADDQKL